MEKFGKVFKTIFTIAIIVAISNVSFAQCVKFTDIPDGDDAKSAYSTYRTYVDKLKTAAEYSKLDAETFGIVKENWSKVYSKAPATDGLRPTVWRDGIKLYSFMISTEKDETIRQEYYEMVLKLYTEEQECYKTKGKPSYAIGRQAFDMYYGIGVEEPKMRSSYDEAIKVMAQAVEVGGNDTEYIVLDPYARVAVYQFTNEKMDKLTARGIYNKLNEIADHNIANNEALKAYFVSAKESVNKIFAPIENNIFDCEFFIAKYQPEYPDNKGNEEFLVKVITILKQTGCTSENSPFLVELEKDYSGIVGARNAAAQAEFEANNPVILAKRAQDAGDYAGAIAKYEEAISSETDNEKLGLYHFKIGQIKGKKMKSFSGGMASARKAAALRPNWGEPLLLMGDLYIQNRKGCGDDFKMRCVYIAAVDKYRAAKAKDPNVAEKANKKIANYNSTRPDKDTGFMKGYKEGQTIQLPCIGTSISLRY